MTRYYLDACIWRDYFENRSDRFRPLGEWAFYLIKNIIKNNDMFVISDRLMIELAEEFSPEQIIKIFEIVPEQLIIKIRTKKGQFKEAYRIKRKLNIPFGDILHAILARDTKSVLVSRDKHFYELADEVLVRKPEELI